MSGNIEAYGCVLNNLTCGAHSPLKFAYTRLLLDKRDRCYLVSVTPKDLLPTLGCNVSIQWPGSVPHHVQIIQNVLFGPAVEKGLLAVDILIHHLGRTQESRKIVNIKKKNYSVEIGEHEELELSVIQPNLWLHRHVYLYFTQHCINCAIHSHYFELFGQPFPVYVPDRYFYIANIRNPHFCKLHLSDHTGNVSRRKQQIGLDYVAQDTTVTLTFEVKNMSVAGKEVDPS